MPTGYTADIAKGISFEQYALSCARAFGALVTMRDEPMDAPVPEEFKPSDYHEKGAAEALERMKRVEAMSVAEADKEAESAYRAAQEQFAKVMLEAAQLREKYEAMLAQVEAWKPPTPDHKELKQFMRDQITQSMDFDCKVYMQPPKRKSGEEWRDEEYARAYRDHEYHNKEHWKDVARVGQRNAWLRALRLSFK